MVTFRLFGEKPPTAPIETKICVLGHLADVITYAKFQDDIFRSYDFTGGRISHFPIDFCTGLTTVQRDCAACDIILIVKKFSCAVSKLWPIIGQMFAIDRGVPNFFAPAGG